MKLYYLVFLIGLVVFSHNHEPILAQSIDEDGAQISEDEVDHEVVLIEKIFNLMKSGYSIDEVLAIFNAGKEHSYHQKLVTEINYLLNKHYSKDDVVNIIVNNKEAEKFYAWKNFKAKFELAAVFASFGVILYLVYRYGKTSDDGLLPYHEKEQKINSSLSKKGVMGKEQRAVTKKKSQKSKTGSNKSNNESFRPVPHINHRLERAIDRQIEYAKVLEPIEMEFDIVDIEEEPLDDRKFDEKIAEQLESARTIGLEPA